jgi:hypothetical protein
VKIFLDYVIVVTILGILGRLANLGFNDYPRSVTYKAWWDVLEAVIGIAVGLVAWHLRASFP